MHGQSIDYTPVKQMQLKSLLAACKYAWAKDLSWAPPVRFFGDCMAGSGYDDQGNPGSPLIIRDFIREFDIGGNALCVWCDIEPKHTEKLSKFCDYNSIVLTGQYQIEMRNYMQENVPPKTLGLIYLDDNGCKQIWNDDGFLEYVMRSFRYLDIALHFSEQAFMRSKGARIDWAMEKSAMDILQMVLKYKPASVVYAPHRKHHWRLVYGVASGKMDLRGQSRIKLRDYIESRLEKQMSLLEMEA